jgi:two-component system, OmpR family, sensor histidine kinase QseC
VKSLRARIFGAVAAVTLLVWSAAAAWTYTSTRAEIQRVLDRRLVEAANMVSSLLGNVEGAMRKDHPFDILDRNGTISRQLSCQIWTVDGRLVGRSAGAPSAPLSLQQSGFSERVYTVAETERSLRVMVGDNLEVRQRLVGDLMTGLLLPSLGGILALALLIWSAVGAGLAPLRDITRKLRARRPDDLGPLGSVQTSSELAPVVQSLNELFFRLEQFRSNEKHFIASAAHELQTPLAGLRTHAQIALIAKDEAVRQNSLRLIQTSVDRTSRLVHQLLELAREEAASGHDVYQWVSLAQVLSAVAEGLPALRERRGIDLDISARASAAEVFVDESSLTLALRNLVENAVNHSSQDDIVHVDVVGDGERMQIAVMDRGPGIPADEIDKVRDRFVRGAREKTAGSGLGLSIVELVAARSDARLELVNRVDRGLCAALSFPAGRVRFGAELIPPRIP